MSDRLLSLFVRVVLVASEYPELSRLMSALLNSEIVSLANCS